ncbi:MAG: tetratricopeptide repeat protein [Gemmatimonadetes bacterium]|nr:tetratricopeptide repeat protein [Gemmatimonadota bacterium]
MNPRPVRVEQALDLLPDLDDLMPLREALLVASRQDEARAWAASGAYGTLDTRLTDAATLEEALPAVIAKVQRRIALVYGEVVSAMRALEAGDLAAAAGALVAAGEAEEEAGRLAAAERFYGKAAEIGRRPRDRRQEGLGLRRLARVAKARGELARALDLYERGFTIAEAQRDREGMVVACQGLGNVLVEQGRWAEAEASYQRGLTLLAGDGPSRLLWQLESNLSVVARRAGRLEESAEWLERARLTVERIGDAAGRTYVYNAEGLLRVARGDPAAAEPAYREALASAGSPVETARVLVNLVESLLLQHRITEAEAAVRRLEQIAVTHGLIATLPYVYRALGGVARARGEEDGFVFYEQALELCRESRLPDFEAALTQLEYAGFEAELGRAESALARLAEARAVFAALNTWPELARVEAAIAELRRDAGSGDDSKEEG